MKDIEIIKYFIFTDDNNVRLVDTLTEILKV